MTAKRIWVGTIKNPDPCGKRSEVFRYAGKPTEATHGDFYVSVVGPFHTVRGAKFMVKYGRGNPHCRSVGEAERLALLNSC